VWQHLPQPPWRLRGHVISPRSTLLLLLLPTAERALKEAQLELQLTSRKQNADLELAAKTSCSSRRQSWYGVLACLLQNN